MNSRKAARSVPATVSRLLKSNAFLKKPPPAFYPTLSYPPPPSLVRSLPSRSPEDLPRTTLLSPYQQAKRKLDNGDRLTDIEQQLLASSAPDTKLTRRKPPRPANSRNNRPLPIVFPEDEVRKAFFRDHPFEAYRPIYLAEGESVAEEAEPKGLSWTSLLQRSRIPTAEDAIAFVVNLHEVHGHPLYAAYAMATVQFRTLRAEHETALRAATLEARAHGAVFYGEIQRGVAVEERILDQWGSAREIEEQIKAKRPGTGGVSLSAVSIGGSLIDAGEGLVEAAGLQVEFTGGEAYVERFQNRAALLAERDAGPAEENLSEAR
ncbi:small subunit ribosomal protein S23, partial [Phenoliferia sp. Uapishka_3]